MDCFEGEPVVDGEGNLTFAYDDPPVGDSRSNYWHAFFPSDGTAGRVVSGQSLLGPRTRGFFRSVQNESSQWVVGVAPDGSDQDVIRVDSDPACQDFVYAGYGLTPDPRGGYVQARIRLDFGSPTGKIIRMFDVRWMNGDLTARTQWLAGTTWDYSYNIDANVYVEPSGKTLVMLFFDPPMSMPCHGTMTRAFWASDDGSLVAFTPTTPTMNSWFCADPQFAGFGSGAVLEDGSVAFYHSPANGQLAPSVSGWYVRYPAGSGVGTMPPPWLNDYDGSLTLLSGGRGYLATRRDPTSCARTAQILNPAGQLCASLDLDGSEGCDDNDAISTDGTLVLHRWSSCSVRWWPGLGRSR